MNKETALSALRALLNMAGAYLIGKSLFGHSIDSQAFQLIAGCALAVVGTLWGVFSKDAAVDAKLSALRSAIQLVCGLFVSLGVINEQTQESIMAIVPAIVTVLQGHTGRTKALQIADGTVGVNTNGKVTEAPPRIR